ncbi:MAG TPA: phosphatidate cytidylyltransferase [Candidatus Binatia bacterium]|nr:phosphatidate cytidylyltransferase [Candidatus Binatia bacterium]
MSPQTALHDPVFRLYALVAAAILLVAGIVLVLLRWGLRKNVDAIWKTYSSWLIIAPLVLGLIWAGRVPTIVGFSLVAIFGFKEFARATGLYRDWWMTGAVYLGIIAVACTSLFSHPHGGAPGWYGLFMTLPIYVVAVLLLVPVILNRTQGQLQALALAILGFIYIGWMFSHFPFLANSNRPYAYLLYLVFAVELNDVAAFTFGKLFGRHKFRSNISPNKTWEGALGALAVSMALPWLLRGTFPHFGPLQLILAGIIVGVGGQLGDLSISVIKRDIGIKDMGALIPGHGGILDRIDSLIYTAPLFLHMVDYFYVIW